MDPTVDTMDTTHWVWNHMTVLDAGGKDLPNYCY